MTLEEENRQLHSEVERLQGEVERLSGWLRVIDGGDKPILDEFVLRRMAYRAVTLHEPVPKEGGR